MAKKKVPSGKKASNDDLSASFHQLIRTSPDRISRLQDAVNETARGRSWVADRTADSLTTLAEWFSDQATVRVRSEREVSAIKSRLKFEIPVSTKELSDDTISLSFDIGLYVAEVLKSRFPQLEWAINLSKPKHANYGQPVLRGFGHEEFNPLRSGLMFARALVDRRYGPDRLKQIYQYWAERAQRSEHI